MNAYQSGFRSVDGKEVFRSWYQSVCEAAHIDYSCRFIETRFGPTHVACGETSSTTTKSANSPSEKPAIVFLHGWSGNGMIWELTNDMAAVSERYKLYMVDLIGQPGHSSQRTPPLKGTGYGDWLVDLLDGLGLQSARFVGMSFGCVLVSKLAQVAPERIEKAALIVPAGFTGIRKRPLNLFYFLAPKFKSDRANLERFVRKMILAPTPKLDSVAIQKMVDLFEISFRHHKSGAQLPYVMPAKEWAALQMPCLVLAGEHDQLFEAGPMLARAKEVLPNLAKAEIMEGVGHAMENYPELSRIVRDFFSRQSKESA